MSGPEFYQTKMGRIFYEGTMPDLAKQLKRLNEILEENMADNHIPFVLTQAGQRFRSDEPNIANGPKAAQDSERAGGHRMPTCPHCQVALVNDGNDAPGFHHCPKCESSFMSVSVRCDGCGWKGLECELELKLEEVPDLAQRLDPGGEVPAGVCPECGALAYLERSDNKVLEHLDHVDRLEVAWYGTEGRPDSVTVECTKCGEVIHELFNAEFES